MDEQAVELEGAIATAGVLGLGVIGCSWVHAFVARGLRVKAWDPSPRARTALAESLPTHGELLTIVAHPAEASSDVAFLQENAPEKLEVKRRLFEAVEPVIGQDTIVASSTSTIMPSELQQDLSFADRLVVGHPFNPPHLIPLVEVIGGEATSELTLRRTIAFYRQMGKHPIRLRTERPGHLANRLQAAIWREAIDAVASGQASVADVDAALTMALAPRWSVMGPFGTFNLAGGEGGLAHFLAHLGEPFARLWDDARRPIIDGELAAVLSDQTANTYAGMTYVEQVRSRDENLQNLLNVLQRDSDRTSKATAASCTGWRLT